MSRIFGDIQLFPMGENRRFSGDFRTFFGGKTLFSGSIHKMMYFLKNIVQDSFRHGISVEKQFSYSFKVQVLAVIHLNT